MKPLLSLVMIVKDEARVIRRTLESVRGVVDRIDILDTGSTDGTQLEILSWAAQNHVPAQVREEPFVDYSTSRNRALELAKDSAEFLLMLSADEVLLDAGKLRDWLSARRPGAHDALDVRYRFGEELHGRSPRITSANGKARYGGVTHEALVADSVDPEIAPATVHYDSGPIDKRARWELDLKLLRKAVTDDPTNTRAMFYLAQTLGCLGYVEAAHFAYALRANMGGFREEQYEAAYRAARLAEISGWPWAYVEQRFLEAHETSPHRAEPLFRIAEHYLFTGEPERARGFAAEAARCDAPKNDRMFHERHVYAWQALDVLGQCEAQTGNPMAAAVAYELALESDILPRPDRLRISRYLDACRKAA